MRYSRTTPRAIGFTLVELLVVIGIFVILLAIAVPAFSSMMYSSEQSMAENAVRIGVAAGRDAALRAGAGRDGAAVFVYENRRIQIVPCVSAGYLDDVDAAGDPVVREIFAPVGGFEPVKLPRTWTVRGYAIPDSINLDWYEDTYPDTAGLRQEGHWVFPETAFYDDEAGDEGQHRQSFMVRFEGGTGMLKPDPTLALVLFPSESTYFRTAMTGMPPWNTTNPVWRADEESDGSRFIARVRAAPPTGPGSLDALQRQQLIGGISTDTVLVRGVAQVALCNEKSLAAALGGINPQVRLHNTTGSLYQVPVPPTPPTKPQFVDYLDNDDALIRAISAWVENRLPEGNVPGNPLVPSEARIFTVQRYSGALQEVTGSRNAQGVTQ